MIQGSLSKSIALSSLATVGGPTIWIYTGDGGVLTFVLAEDDSSISNTITTSANEFLPIAAKIVSVFPANAFGLA